jgi:hypothetical protein
MREESTYRKVGAGEEHGSEDGDYFLGDSFALAGVGELGLCRGYLKADSVVDLAAAH